MQDLADYPIRNHDGLVGLESRVGSFVNQNDARGIVRAGAEDLCGYGRKRYLLAKIKQNLQPLAFFGLLAEPLVLDRHRIELVLQCLVYPAG
jgi:hypothetical protein